MSIYIGGLVEDYSAMQGPAPSSFHVPLISEWQGLKTIMDGLGLTTGDSWRINLHIPFAGFRDYSTAGLKNQGSYGSYWSSSPYGSDYPYGARYLYLNSSLVSANSRNLRANGLSVRCFKDSYVAPDSNWTVIAGTLGSAGIFWNQSEGLISITDGTTGYTIQDKNLGATTVYSDGDTLTEANMGYMYQWGNNYGFPSTGSVTTSSTQVNAQNYGPGNYYSSSTFITTSNDWSSVHNHNLRGGETGVVTKPQEVQNIYIGEYTPEFATRGPAPEGFHVPLYTEWQGLYTIMSGLGLTTTGNSWRINLHMPFVGYRSWSSAEIGNQGSNGRYWSSSPVEKSTNHNDARYLWISSSSVGANYGDPRTQAYSVRCFKNSYVTPDSSWTVVQGTLGSAGIFRNQTKGLISITSDGTTGYTIQDKNLGATAVYNDGNTLSEANCGKYYQWGNNYGFPFTGSVTTSSTQVDTTGYGPGNYYSSNTFITRSGDYRDWSSVQNDNLRGGEDGNVPV